MIDQPAGTMSYFSAKPAAPPFYLRFSDVPAPWSELHALADRHRPLFSKGFAAAHSKLQAGIDQGELVRAITLGSSAHAEHAIGVHQLRGYLLTELRPAYRTLFKRAGTLAAKHLDEDRHQFAEVGVNTAFDSTNQAAVDWIERNVGVLVQDVSEAQRRMIVSMVHDAFTQGIEPARLAKQIRERIGLTSQQQQYVSNYRDRLEAQGNLKEGWVDKLVARYQDNWVKYRAMTIARTETIRTAIAGQQELWNQSVASGRINPVEYEQLWIITPDDITCEDCREYNGERAPMGGAFMDGVAGPPLHPRCRCAIGLVRVDSPRAEQNAPDMAPPGPSKLIPRTPKSALVKGASEAAGWHNHDWANRRYQALVAMGFYSPEQERDERGRWTAGGGGDESAATAGAGGLRESGGLRGGPGFVGASGSPDHPDGVSREPLVGLPTQVSIPGVGKVEAGPNLAIREVAAQYMQSAGLPYNPPTDYVKADPERGARIATEFDKMRDDPHDPHVAAAYNALIHETTGQYKALMDAGLKVEFINYAKQGDPYAASPRLAIQDINQNNHMWVFSTKDGFGSDTKFDPSRNPLLRDTSYQISGQTATANDLFRVVHDVFGHAKEGIGMRADGEENAWRSHVAMFSPLAARAMTTETRGQNSWVNFGPYAASNKTASGSDTHYADQKVGLLPSWVSTEGARTSREHAEPLAFYSPDQERDERGRWTSGGGGDDKKDDAGSSESHPGPSGVTWTQPVDATGRPIPIKVDTVEAAVPLVLAGKVVEVPTEREAYTLIEKLAQVAKEDQAAGKGARDFDLCNVTVSGSSMFCAQSLRTKEYPNGVPRLDMPQLGGKPVPGTEADKLPRNPWDPTEVDGAKQFISYLQGVGIRTTTGVIPAENLRASQAELVGTKVAGMMDDKTFQPATNPIFISRDNYIVDGHHRWAAVVGRDLEAGTGHTNMNYIRVDAPITEVLHIANAWSTKFGIAQAAGPKTHSEWVPESLLWEPLSFAGPEDEERDERGRWTAGGGGGESGQMKPGGSPWGSLPSQWAEAKPGTYRAYRGVHDIAHLTDNSGGWLGKLGLIYVAQNPQVASSYGTNIARVEFTTAQPFDITAPGNAEALARASADKGPNGVRASYQQLLTDYKTQGVMMLPTEGRDWLVSKGYDAIISPTDSGNKSGGAVAALFRPSMLKVVMQTDPDTGFEMGGRARTHGEIPEVWYFYSPDQERDEHGRWTSGGGSDDQGHGKEPPGGGHAAERSMLSMLKATNGFSYAPAGDRFQMIKTTGFAVSPFEAREQTFDRPVSRADLHTFMAKNADLLAQPDHYVGGWRDPVTGKVFLDVSIIVGDRGHAESLAAQYHQLGIFDFRTGETIDTSGASQRAHSERDGRGDRPLPRHRQWIGLFG